MQKDGRLELETVEGTGLRFRATTDSNFSFIFDCGQGAVGPNPMEGVLCALGACAGMDVITILRKKRLAVTSYTVEMHADRREEHPRVFTRIEAVHRVRGRGIDPAAVEDAVRLSETKYCSVQGMLAPTVALSSRIEIEEEGG